MIPKLIVIQNNGVVITERGRKELNDKGIAAARSWLDTARLRNTPR